MLKQATEGLELGVIQAALRSRVRTELGAARAEALAPLPEVALAVDRMEAISEARGLLDLAEAPPVSGAEDVSHALVMAEKELVLEGAQLRAAARTLDAGSQVMLQLLNHEERAPRLFALAASLDDRSDVSAAILRCFEPDGTLSDHASADLGPLRRRVRSLEEAIRAKLGELLRAPKLADLLQENYFTIRNERHVLPIKASFKHEVPGIVHDASGSGQTVFIEPQSLVDLGNRLTIAKSEQAEEEHRILSRLTLLVADEAPMIREMMRVVAEVDFLTAGARLAIDLRAIEVPLDPEPGFNLIRARHPILLLQALAPPDPEGEMPVPSEVIGNDFALEDGQQVLIVTGPNTGGKTVAMKTVGLFALMARAGLHLPCSEGSRIGWYTNIEVAIGDMQSIRSNLSTFAAHVKALIRILKHSGPNTLVLVDEIASDTDPTQGQALAQALLEALADSRSHVIVTTHFERLKAVPFVDKRFRNAGVGFDATALRPTYQVTLDVPQSSSGFEIAQRLGLSPAVVDRARDLIGEGAHELEALIKEVERQGNALKAAKRALEDEKQKLQKAREAVERERQQLAQKQAELRQGAQASLVADIEEKRQAIYQSVARLKAATEEASAEEAIRLSHQLADQLGKAAKHEREQLPEAPQAPKTKHALKGRPEVGDWVHVPRFGKDGDLVALDDKMAHVAIGNMRLRVPLSELERPKRARPRKSVRPAPREFKAKAQKPEAPLLIMEEFDVRGSSVDEAIARTEGYLDHHFNASTTHVCLIHGHGTGALREALREHLRRSGYVKSLRPGEQDEGGDGVTIIELG